MKNIGVVFGGVNVEHDISIITAMQVMQALNKEEFCIVPIYISKDGTWETGDNLLDIKSFKSEQKNK